jgi:hypothetical protein
MMVTVTVPDLLGSWVLVALTTVLPALLEALKVMPAPVLGPNEPAPLTMLQVTDWLNPPVPVTTVLRILVALILMLLGLALTVTLVTVPVGLMQETRVAAKSKAVNGLVINLLLTQTSIHSIR